MYNHHAVCNAVLLLRTINNKHTRHITSSIAVNWCATPSHTNISGCNAFNTVVMPKHTCTIIKVNNTVLNFLNKGAPDIFFDLK